MCIAIFLLESGVLDEMKKYKVSHLTEEERVERLTFIRSEIEKRIETVRQSTERYDAPDFQQDVRNIYFVEQANIGDHGKHEDLIHQLRLIALGSHPSHGRTLAVSNAYRFGLDQALHDYAFSGVTWFDFLGWLITQYKKFFILGLLVIGLWFYDAREAHPEKKWPSFLMYVLSCLCYPISISYVIFLWLWKWHEKATRHIWFETELRRRKQRIFDPLSEREKVYLSHALDHFGFKQWVDQLEALGKRRQHSIGCALFATITLSVLPQISTSTLTYSTHAIIGSAVISQTVGEMHLARANIDDASQQSIFSQPVVDRFILIEHGVDPPLEVWYWLYWFDRLVRKEKIPDAIDHIPRFDMSYSVLFV